MLFLTIINALPLKKRMKNAFLDNHIFTEYNLGITKVEMIFAALVMFNILNPVSN